MHPVCTLAREITKWNFACDRRLYRLVCYLQSTRTHCLHGWIGDSADKLSIMIFTDASFADCVQRSKSTTGIFAALVGPNTFFPFNAICKKQTVVSHSSTESEIVALDTALRIEGLPLLSFWEAVVSTGKNNSTGSKEKGQYGPEKGTPYGRIIAKSDNFETDIADFIAGHNHCLRIRTPSCSGY